MIMRSRASVLSIPLLITGESHQGRIVNVLSASRV
jgi:hypothetical protein